MILSSPNIPEEIKQIVLAICKGYVRATNGLIGLENVQSVCNTKFKSIQEDDLEFAGATKIMGQTSTAYDESGKVSHIMYYQNASDYIKLIEKER